MLARMLVGMKMSATFKKLKKTKTGTDPASPLLYIHPQEMKSVCQRGTCTPVLAVALFKMTGYAVN
jgi:hypothetical protein